VVSSNPLFKKLPLLLFENFLVDIEPVKRTEYVNSCTVEYCCISFVPKMVKSTRFCRSRTQASLFYMRSELLGEKGAGCKIVIGR